MFRGLMETKKQGEGEIENEQPIRSKTRVSPRSVEKGVCQDCNNTLKMKTEVFCIWPQEVLAGSTRAISVGEGNPIVLQLKNEWEKKWKQSYLQCF